MPTLTVFTPAYNRAHTLPRTYASLCAQDSFDFEWLIVDDGSVDNTKALVAAWQSEDHGFPIRYIYRENGGMHAAHNTAYENITTELNVCIDSDDGMPPHAVSSILAAWEKVRDKGYAGLIGLDADMNTGAVIGRGFPDGLTETTLGGYYANGGAGDKKLVYRTDVINQYPAYPLFQGEKYVALGYKYLLVDQDYKLSVLPEVLCLVEYQQDGSSKNMYRQYLRNPRGFAFWRTVCMRFPTSKKRLLMDVIHYVADSRIAKNPHFIKESPRPVLTTLLTPCGLLLSAYIKHKVKSADAAERKEPKNS